MIKQQQYTKDQYHKMYMSAMLMDNFQAAAEVLDHQEFYGNTVEVFKGRKVPIGTKGVVVAVVRKSFCGPWDYFTSVCIKTDCGETYWTNKENVKKLKK